MATASDPQTVRARFQTEKQSVAAPEIPRPRGIRGGTSEASVFEILVSGEVESCE
eukprot:Cvel_28813.t1-p1 / transcript=Cvel_28813.t1 / gene=Cvel_28813 / organism=Chromera_velia_CCMP2878 / gene_product=hypothetical protein / transcript_product=hypothetical protein / location=Cvel_scaffold3841:1107-2017(-) / protein_length=54 / sequence_SO=supercontig / SO=protein_coding / is_pseudo=false